MTFGAPVPALKFETWNVVGWKCSVPLSHTRLVSSASAGAKRVHRVLRELRIRDVPLHAVHCEPAAEGAAPADLDRVADDLLARRLADDAPVDALVASPQASRPRASFRRPRDLPRRW